MKHENVIGLLDVFTPGTCMDDFNDVYFVNHLMGCDLNQIIKTQKLSDDHVQFLIYQILRGLKYIHSAGIIHRVRSYVIHDTPLVSFAISTRCHSRTCHRTLSPATLP